MTNYKEGTRDRIVDSAINQFRNRPYDDVSVKDICDEAGVTRNSFYYYFESKEMVFDAIGDWCSRTARSRLLDSMTSLITGSAYERIWEIFKAYLDVQLELGNEIMNRVILSRTQRSRSDYYSYIDDRLAKILTQLIADAQTNGEIRNDWDPAALVSTSNSVVYGVNMKWCFQWGQTDVYEDCMYALNALFMPNPGFELK
ncbi:MAG: TetR/AcrR family transcriptional regulator [Oscillospiraceae bacterium]|nr:TetR/AcrR family transcriptional regulator [Oscillospiraceae bacterium]